MLPQIEQEGYWWARWHTPDPATEDDGDGCFGDVWEPVQVFLNSIDPDSDESWRVFVPGVQRSQPLDAFEWGDPIPKPQKYERKELSHD